MLRLAALALGVMLALPASALDLDNMSDSERQSFEAAVRAYLLEHPEVIFEAVDVYEQRQKTVTAKQDADMIAANAQAIFADGVSWVGGNPEGDITVVEFLDYRCGYCKKAYDEVNQLIESDGNIRFVVKELPILGEESILGARFAIAVRNSAGPEAYAAVHDELMTMRGTLTEATLDRIAARHDLDMEVVAAAMVAQATDDEIQDNYLLAQKLGINGTPGFVFETEMQRGYAPLDTMRAVVDRVRGG